LLTQENKVTLQSAARGGKKHVTVITGLELFGMLQLL